MVSVVGSSDPGHEVQTYIGIRRMSDHSIKSICVFCGASFGKDPAFRAAAEELGHTLLSCVFVGLSKAPDMVLSEEIMKSSYLSQS